MSPAIPVARADTFRITIPAPAAGLAAPIAPQGLGGAQPFVSGAALDYVNVIIYVNVHKSTTALKNRAESGGEISDE